MDYEYSREVQLEIEHTYSEHFINQKIAEAIHSIEANQYHHAQGVAALKEWLSQEHYEEKQQRLNIIRGMDLNQLVTDIFIGIAYCQSPELYVSVTAQLANILKFDEQRESILTIAEIVGVLGHLNAFDIYKPHPRARLRIQSNLVIPESVIEHVVRARYLPPMVCKPEPVVNNYQSPYLTLDNCLILGKYNGHDGDICLDVINTQNSIALSLDREFLETVEEVPKTPFETEAHAKQWHQFVSESQDVYRLMLEQGNKFYILNKVDKRGRMYSQGYHINPQGMSYKKAMINLANEELVQGVPQ